MAEEEKKSLDESGGEEVLLQKDEVRLVTHNKINTRLCGEAIDLKEGYAKIELETKPEMIVDSSNMIHTGFIYSGAAFAAVAAVNDPTALVVGSDVRFLAPIDTGNTIIFEAKTMQKDTKKREVRVIGVVLDIKIFEALFHVVIFEKHVLKLRLNRGGA